MNKELTKGQINKIGESIRAKLLANETISKEELINLQQYRLSFKEPLNKVNTELNRIMKQIDKSGVITYRVKRIESIFSKLLRIQKMDLARMHDIAGARCILQNEAKVRLFVEELKKSAVLEVKDIDDYITTPRDTGYKSIHLRCLCDGKYIEIQVRDEVQHSWATLVEITDVIYKTKIKENKDDKGTGLYKFLQLFSKSKNLTTEERATINDILIRTRFIQKLTNTFTKNAIVLRDNWCKKEHKTGQFYIFEVDKKNNPNIETFNDFVIAEEKYFSTFTTDIHMNEKNLVMAYISNDDFELISKAYSNYVLIKHNFYLNLINILRNDTGNPKINKKSFELLYSCILNNIYVHISELNIIITSRKKINKKYVDWRNNIKKELKEIPMTANAKYNVKWINAYNLTYYKIKIKLFFMEARLNNILKDLKIKD